jgi:hypothetical protein
VVDHAIETDPDGTTWLKFVAPLSPVDHTVVSLHTPFMTCPDEVIGNGDKHSLGLVAADIVIEAV